ncbi:MAG: hypothetical protein IT285_06190 [Bdellovibrionales bacterium]|nr:hypothetical protein [Bdellovibrionales bacterium]
MTVKSNLRLVTEPSVYFQELVSQALAERHLRPRPETEFYLVNLLKQFLSTENLFMRDSQGAMRDEPLAIKLKEALEAPDRSSQNLMLRQVGDVSLYTAGFFHESLSRKSVDVGYYIGMGGTAYQKVSAQQGEPHRSMFAELADKFGNFVGVLSGISETALPAKTEQDLLRLYDLWLATGSDRAARALREAGIEPTQVKGTPKAPQ